MKREIKDGKLNEKNTAILRSSKLLARSNGSQLESVLCAAYHAKKSGKVAWVYCGNASMVQVWRVTFKASDVACSIGNTGNIAISIHPDLSVYTHEVA